MLFFSVCRFVDVVVRFILVVVVIVFIVCLFWVSKFRICNCCLLVSVLFMCVIWFNNVVL